MTIRTHAGNTKLNEKINPYVSAVAEDTEFQNQKLEQTPTKKTEKVAISMNLS